MIRFLIPKAGFILRMQIYAVYRNTQTILHTLGAFSRSPMPIYAVGIAQMPSINTPTIRVHTRRDLRRSINAITRAAKLSLLNFLSLFRDLQKSTRFSGGGGVVAELFPCSPEADAIQWGGSSGIFLRFLRDQTTFGGGGSNRHFTFSSVAKSHFCPTSSDIRG